MMENVKGDRASAERLFGLIGDLNDLAQQEKFTEFANALASFDETTVRDMALILLLIPEPAQIAQACKEFMEQVYGNA